jgi:hypothetical protein
VNGFINFREHLFARGFAWLVEQDKEFSLKEKKLHVDEGEA